MIKKLFVLFFLYAGFAYSQINLSFNSLKDLKEKPKERIISYIGSDEKKYLIGDDIRIDRAQLTIKTDQYYYGTSYRPKITSLYANIIDFHLKRNGEGGFDLLASCRSKYGTFEVSIEKMINSNHSADPSSRNFLDPKIVKIDIIKKPIIEKDRKIISGVKTEYFKIVIDKNTIPRQNGSVFLEMKELVFIEKNKELLNKKIDAGEICEIKIPVKNKGDDNSYKLKADVLITGGTVNTITETIEVLEPNKEDTIILKIEAPLNLKKGKVVFYIVVKDYWNNSTDKAEIEIETDFLKLPDLRIVDYKLTSNIKKYGMVHKVNTIIQNLGQVPATGFYLKAKLPKDVYFTYDIDSIYLGELRPNESTNIVLSFIIKEDYIKDTIPIKYFMSCSEIKIDTFVDLLFGEEISSTVRAFKIEAINDIVKIDTISLTSDVDKNIPINKNTYINRYALVIGNENYERSNQPLVDYAINDAKSIKEYLVKTLGFPQEQVKLILNATGGEMKNEIRKFRKLMDLDSLSEFLFYYAGHGYPDLITNTPYLIPVDITAANINEAIKLDEIYQVFGTSKAKHVSIWLDACFSGGIRGSDNGLLAARSVRVKPRDGEIYNNTIVITSSSGQEISFPYHEKFHGLFTYYLLKKIKESEGGCSPIELAEYIKTNVTKQSLLLYSKEQTPEIKFREESKIHKKYQSK